MTYSVGNWIYNNHTKAYYLINRVGFMFYEYDVKILNGTVIHKTDHILQSSFWRPVPDEEIEKVKEEIYRDNLNKPPGTKFEYNFGKYLIVNHIRSEKHQSKRKHDVVCYGFESETFYFLDVNTKVKLV